MNATEITNERLLEISSFYGGNEVGILARAELDRRKAGEQKGETVRYYKSAHAWYAISNDKVIDRVLNDAKVLPIGYDVVDVDSLLDECTAAEYEAAKANTVKPVASFCHDCGTVHEGGCVNTSEAKDPAHQPDCAISLMPPPPEEGYRYDLQALHDKINEIIAAVNRLAKDGK